MIVERIAALAERGEGTLGLWARCLDTGETVEYHGYEEFPAASTIKLPILYELFRQAELGKIDLEATMSVSATDVVVGSGVLKDLGPTVRLSVRDLATLMIIVSDNTATNIIIDLVGKEHVNATMIALGLPEIRLENKLFMGLPGQPINRATPTALGSLMERIVRSAERSSLVCYEIIKIMKKQHTKQHITRYLPGIDDFPEQGQEMPIVVASKSGSIRGTRNEVGVVWAHGKCYVICMMSKHLTDLRFYADNKGSLLLARVSRVIYDHFITEE